MRHLLLTLVAALALVAPATAAPTIDVWYGDYQEFGQLGIPQQWVNVLGTVEDPTHGVTSLTYSLNGGPDLPLSIGPDDRRLYFAGDFNVEIDFLVLLDGMNSVVIEAQNGIGEITQRTVTVNFASTNVWPLPFLADWSAAASLHDVAQVTDGRWSVVAGPPAGIRPDEMAYDRAFVIGDLGWTNFEVTIPITVHATGPIGPVSGAPGIGFTNRWRGHTTLVPGEQPNAFWLPQGANLWYDFGVPEFFLAGSDGLFVSDPLGRTLTMGTTYLWKLRAQSTDTGETFYGAKIWEEGEAEPAGWQMSGFEGPPDILDGSLIVIAHHVDATFGAVDVVPLGTLTTDPPPPSSMASDDFSGASLSATGWTFVNPLGDSTASLNGTQLSISAPATAIHDVWINSNTLPRVMRNVADEDFEVEIAVESDLTADFQSQGLLVEESPTDVLRIEFHHVGGETRLFVAKIDEIDATVVTNLSLPLAPPMYLRLRRLGDAWTVRTSADGTVFTTRAAFNAAMNVTRVGVYAGNSGVPHTAVFDYFENTASPIASEDGDPSALLVNTVGAGTVAIAPAQSHYDVGQNVSLTPQPASGWAFVGWSGAAGGSASPLALAVASNPTTVTATFAPDGSSPPVLTNVQVAAGESSATITWNTDVPSDSRVDYGTTTAYTGFEEDAALVTGHSITLLNLAPDTTYHFEASSVDAQDEQGVSGDMTFQTAPAGSTAGVFSDDFSGAALDGWTFRNPLDDSTSFVNGTQLEIGIPSSPIIHDIWIQKNEAPRVVQEVNDGDFDVAAKFESVPSQDFQSQGIVVLQDDVSLVRSELHHAQGQTFVFVATLLGPSAQIKTQTPIALTNPMWLRVQRVGDLFNVYTSTNGSDFTMRASFTEALSVTEVGVFAGSSAFTPFTAVVDSFEELSDPIVGEDADPSALVVNTLGRGTVTRSPNLSHYDVGQVVDLTAVPDPGYALTQWSGDASGSASPIAVSVTGGPTSVVAEFGSSTAGPPVLTDIMAQPFAQAVRITWTTNEPATSVVRYGVTPYANEFQDPTLKTDHNVFISGLTQLTDYHFQVESTDASLETTTSGDMTFRTKKKSCGIVGIEPFLALGLVRVFRRRR